MSQLVSTIDIRPQRTGRFEEAEARYEEALGIYRQIPGTEIDQANCLMNLGDLYHETQEFSKARQKLNEALKICKQFPLGAGKIKNKCLEILSQMEKAKGNQK